MPDSVEELARALEQARGWGEQLDALSRVQAAIAAKLEVRTLLPIVVALLSSADEWTVEEAARTLGRMGDARAVEPLCRLLPTPAMTIPSDDEGRNAVLAAAMVASERDAVEHAAIVALEALGSREAIAALSAVVDSSWAVDRNREAAKRALATLRGGAEV